MRAPRIIYTTSGDQNGLDGAFLYEDGVIAEIQSEADYDYFLLSTDDGYIVIMTHFALNDFSLLRIGESVRVGFVYLGILSSDSSANMTSGMYLEMLDVPRENNTDGSSDIPGWLLNNTPSDSSPGQSGPSSGNDIPDWLLNDTSASDTDPDYSYQEPFNPTGETTGQSNRETVYWVENGEKYHSSPDCVSLKRSKRILQGTLGEAIRTGHDEPCNLCC